MPLLEMPGGRNEHVDVVVAYITNLTHAMSNPFLPVDVLIRVNRVVIKTCGKSIETHCCTFVILLPTANRENVFIWAQSSMQKLSARTHQPVICAHSQQSANT